MKKNVYIIGAGLSGLAAAYELSKDDSYNITILEKNDYIGGRVKSLEVGGHMVDFGGFIVFPWYTEYHRLSDELELSNKYESLEDVHIFYEMEGIDSYVRDDSIKHSNKELLRFVASILPTFRKKDSRDVAHPPLDIFEDRSIKQHFEHTFGKETSMEKFFNTVCQGYCYGSIDHYRMSMVLPILYNTFVKGNFKDSHYFCGSNAIMPQTMAKKLKERGVNIVLNAKVDEVHDKQITTADGSVYDADAIIFSGYINNVLAKNLLGSKSLACDYTSFYTVALKAPEIPAINDEKLWGSVFVIPDDSRDYQTLSVINLRSMFPKKKFDYIEVNLIDRNKKDKALTKKQLFDIISKDVEKIIPGIKIESIETFVRWTHTMPVATEAYVTKIRELQGKNDIYFCGDSITAPSMESALQTGKQAAELLKQNK